MKAKNMFVLVSLSLVLVAWSGVSFAEGETAADPTAQSTPASGKSARKKKVAMCQDCGKPEAQCECEGHGKDEKKDAKQETGEKH